MSHKLLVHNKRFLLESGLSLPKLEIAYHTFGKLNADKSNVVWVTHALTANSNVYDWWKGLFGINDLFNPNDYFVVCANNLGSCYGTTGSLSINPDTNEPWYAYFPEITIRDMANALQVLKEHLGIEKIHTLIGGSQGGQIALEWSLLQKDISEHLILIATNAQHSSWGVAFNESQRLAIKADRTYFSNSLHGGEKGLVAARSIALLSYRSYETYVKTQSRDKYLSSNASSYQRYQGEKLVKRFNAYAYVKLSEAMDSHDVARNRGDDVVSVLKNIQAKSLVVGVKTDILFPVSEQRFIAENIKDAVYQEIDSLYGHDGFLIETKQLSEHIKQFYQTSTIKIKEEVI